MNKAAIFNFLKSTLAVVLVSALGGLAGLLTGLNFWTIFLLFFAIQYILFYAISTIVRSYFQEKTKQKELDKLENLSTILNCAYCNKPNLMTFRPDDNDRVEFKCEHCKMPNVVTIQFVVARITESVNIPKITGTSLE
jgi:phage FluMu protein Com